MNNRIAGASAPTPRPKYLDRLADSMWRMGEQLQRRRSWLELNCGLTGDHFVELEELSVMLVQEAAAMDKFIHRRRHFKGAEPRVTVAR